MKYFASILIGFFIILYYLISYSQRDKKRDALKKRKRQRSMQASTFSEPRLQELLGLACFEELTFAIKSIIKSRTAHNLLLHLLGGVWKTENAGITASFDIRFIFFYRLCNDGSNNSNVVWVGSGESQPACGGLWRGCL